MESLPLLATSGPALASILPPQKTPDQGTQTTLRLALGIGDRARTCLWSLQSISHSPSLQSILQIRKLKCSSKYHLTFPCPNFHHQQSFSKFLCLILTRRITLATMEHVLLTCKLLDHPPSQLTLRNLS